MNADLLRQLLAPSESSRRYYGVVVAIVTNNRDPEGLHRVKVRFPWLDDENESQWARVASPMAGKGRGAYFLPEVDDEVLVAFEHGCMDYPYVVGSLWNGEDEPPESNASGRNEHRTLRSRSGHVIRFSDGAGSERIEVVDKSGNNRIVIDTRENTIAIQGRSDVIVSSETGTLRLRAVSIEMESKAGVKIQAGSTVDVGANAVMTLKGSVIRVN